MERDEVYVPKTREDLGIPEKNNHEIDWDEMFGDTPIYTLYMLIRQQVLAFPAYLLFNVSGQKTYPKWTNHFDPNSILFTKAQRNAVIMSNIGIGAMVWAVVYSSSVYGTGEVIKYYLFPWLEVSHWCTCFCRENQFIYANLLDSHHDHLPPPHRPHATPLPRQGMELPAWCCRYRRPPLPRLARTLLPPRCCSLPCRPPRKSFCLPLIHFPYSLGE